MRNILEIKNLVVSYGGIEAVKGIDLKVVNTAGAVIKQHRIDKKNK